VRERRERGEGETRRDGEREIVRVLEFEREN